MTLEKASVNGDTADTDTNKAIRKGEPGDTDMTKANVNDESADFGRKKDIVDDDDGANTNKATAKGDTNDNKKKKTCRKPKHPSNCIGRLRHAYIIRRGWFVFHLIHS